MHVYGKFLNQLIRFKLTQNIDLYTIVITHNKKTNLPSIAL